MLLPSHILSTTRSHEHAMDSARAAATLRQHTKGWTVQAHPGNPSLNFLSIPTARCRGWHWHKRAVNQHAGEYRFIESRALVVVLVAFDNGRMPRNVPLDGALQWIEYPNCTMWSGWISQYLPCLAKHCWLPFGFLFAYLVWFFFFLEYARSLSLY